MRLFLCVIFVVVVFPLSAQENPTEEEFEKKVRELIKRLGAEEWREREEAMKRLIEMGDAVGKFLEEALKSDDEEVRMRAEKIIDEIGYVPEQLRKKLTELCDRLKSDDVNVQKKAWKEIQSYGRPAGRFLRKFFKSFKKGGELKAEILFDKKVVYLRKSYEVKLRVKNEGNSPCWLNIYSIRYIRVTVRTENNRSAVSQYASGRFGRTFPFVYFPPGAEKTYTLRMYVPRCGEVTLSFYRRVVETYLGASDSLHPQYPDGSTESIPVPVAEMAETGVSGILALTPPEGMKARNRRVIGKEPLSYSLKVELKKEAEPKEKLTLKAVLEGFKTKEVLDEVAAKWNDRHCFCAVYVLEGEELVERRLLKSPRFDKEGKRLVFSGELTAPEAEGEYRVVVYVSTSYHIFGDVGAPHRTLKVKEMKDEEKKEESEF